LTAFFINNISVKNCQDRLMHFKVTACISWTYFGTQCIVVVVVVVVVIVVVVVVVVVAVVIVAIVDYNIDMFYVRC